MVPKSIRCQLIRAVGVRLESLMGSVCGIICGTMVWVFLRRLIVRRFRVFLLILLVGVSTSIIHVDLVFYSGS